MTHLLKIQNERGLHSPRRLSDGIDLLPPVADGQQAPSGKLQPPVTRLPRAPRPIFGLT
jgi:hypothetical protein